MLTPTDVTSIRVSVAASIARPSVCVPPDTVVVSMTGGKQTALRPLQFSQVKSRRCLLQRVVSLCFGNYTDEFGTCVGARALPQVVGPAQYHRVTWSKWQLLHAALQEARAALFVDADVLLLRNPFHTPSILLARFFGRDAARHEALLYQYEGPGSNPLNSGQLFARSLDAVSDVLAEQPVYFDGDTPLDQEIAFRALNRHGHRTARLPDAFAGNCWFGPPEAPPWCSLITFHGHCTGSLQEKLTRLRLVLRETTQCHELVVGT